MKKRRILKKNRKKKRNLKNKKKILCTDKIKTKKTNEKFKKTSFLMKNSF